MRVVERVTFSEVLTHFREKHPSDAGYESNTNVRGEENLELADELLGSWRRVRLNRADVLEVVLPWHLAEGGGRELIPPAGRTVAGTTELMRADARALATANPVCTAKLNLLGRADFTPLFLSTRAVEHSDYAGLQVREGLIHLDGLHRMLAWELAGRLPEADELDAFVASA